MWIGQKTHDALGVKNAVFRFFWRTVADGRVLISDCHANWISTAKSVKYMEQDCWQKILDVNLSNYSWSQQKKYDISLGKIT